MFGRVEKQIGKKYKFNYTLFLLRLLQIKVRNKILLFVGVCVCVEECVCFLVFILKIALLLSN